MTQKELSQLYYLNREIEQLQAKIDEIETKAESTTKPITGMPNVPGITDRTGKYAIELAHLKSVLEVNIKKCFYERDRLDAYIQSIPDSQMRMILSLRYINGLSWEQVAASIGGISAEGAKKKNYRFIQKN